MFRLIAVKSKIEPFSRFVQQNAKAQDSWFLLGISKKKAEPLLTPPLNYME